MWVAYAIVFFGTIAKRKIKHIYVANWFYGGFILAVALLHIVNNISIPAGLMKSYPVYAGAIDAMVQWWYGHNAVGFFLTAGFLGMMYYFVPKQAGRPIYSYRLSVVHFWALIFTYMWAGSHHLHPMMSIKTVNALSHYTDWTVAHVHAGALGWVGFVTIGSVYYMIPRLFGKNEMYSTKLVEAHFWIATIGVVLYIAAMWIAGVMQGLMWGSLNDDGTLTYSFVESVKRTMPYYMIRFTGGLLYLSGMCIMAYNVYRTAISGKAVDAEIPAVSQTQHH